MSVVRLSYWGIPGYFFFWLLSGVAVTLFLFRIVRLIQFIRLGKKQEGAAGIPKRILGSAGQTISQWCQLKTVGPGDLSAISHILIAWGFMIYFIYYLIFIVIGEGFGLVEALQSTDFHMVYSRIIDIVSPFIVIAACWALVRRYIIKPARLQGEKTVEAFVILITVLIHPLTHLLKEATGIAFVRTFVESGPGWPVFSGLISRLFSGSSPSTLMNLHVGFFWVHWLTVLFVLVFIGYSRYLHMLLAPINIALRPSRPMGALKPVFLAETDTFGVSDVTDFDRKYLLESLSCVACGRCQDVCPAFYTGKDLNPKDVVQAVRTNLLVEGAGQTKNRTAPPENDTTRERGNNFCSNEALWACTTCNGCVETCPVGNNQPGMIVELRRKLVYEGTFDSGQQKVLRKVSKTANPWGIPNQTRGKNLDLEPAREGEKYDCIYWLGCMAGFDDRIGKIAQAVVRIMTAAEMRFAVLGHREKCCGDSVRRIGDEGLFQRLARDNIEALNRLEFDFILTHCPHCYNSLLNEYPDFGGNFKVIHHSQLIDDLLKTGKLSLQETKGKITDVAIFHDPCYLGRYQQIMEEPRRVIRQVFDNRVEFDRNKNRSFCCGAGGGHIWIEAEAGSKISLERLEQALEKDPQVLTTACPFCFLMFQEAIQIKNYGEKIRLVDIAEVVEKYLR